MSYIVRLSQGDSTEVIHLNGHNDSQNKLLACWVDDVSSYSRSSKHIKPNNAFVLKIDIQGVHLSIESPVVF